MSDLNKSLRRKMSLPSAAFVSSATFTPTAGGSNVCEVAIVLKNVDNTTITGPRVVDIYLSDAATGVGLTATTASGAVAAKSASGTDMAVLTTKKALRVQTLANGSYTLSITDTAKTGFYICVVNPSNGAVIVSSPLITANYG